MMSDSVIDYVSYKRQQRVRQEFAASLSSLGSGASFFQKEVVAFFVHGLLVPFQQAGGSLFSLVDRKHSSENVSVGAFKGTSPKTHCSSKAPLPRVNSWMPIPRGAVSDSLYSRPNRWGQLFDLFMVLIYSCNFD